MVLDLPKTWEEWGGLATAVGTIIALFGLLGVFVQLRASRAASMVDTLFHLEELLPTYLDVHTKLRPGGDWQNVKANELKPDDWVRIETYMGLLERVGFMLDAGAVSARQVRQAYGYRIQNIVVNATIFEEKLVKRGQYWQEFIKLAKKVGAKPPSPRTWKDVPSRGI